MFQKIIVSEKNQKIVQKKMLQKKIIVSNKNACKKIIIVSVSEKMPSKKMLQKKNSFEK